MRSGIPVSGSTGIRCAPIAVLVVFESRWGKERSGKVCVHSPTSIVFHSMSWQSTLQIRGLRSPIDLGFLVGAVALIVVGWVAHRSANQLRDDESWVDHTYEVLRVIDQLH